MGILACTVVPHHCVTLAILWRSNKPYNAKSDVWALGVVLYELCQLRVPFDAANFPQLRVKIVHNKPAPLTGPYSPELQQLVSDMLVRACVGPSCTGCELMALGSRARTNASGPTSALC